MFSSCNNWFMQQYNSSCRVYGDKGTIQMLGDDWELKGMKYGEIKDLLGNL